VTPEEQDKIRLAVTGLGKEWCHLKTDGDNVNGTLSAMAFVKGEPGKTLPMAADEQVTPKHLMVGLVWEFGISGDPKHVEVSWTGFADPVEQMPLTVFVGNSAESLELTKRLPSARWSNDAGHLPRPKPLAEVPKLPVPGMYALPLAMIVWVLLGVAIYVWMEVRRFKFPGGFVPFLAAWGVGVVMSYNMGVILIPDPFGEKAVAVTKPDQADKILLPLLKNVYRAFDYRKESDVYERLARSIDGDLLRTLYLQTIQALTLEGQEGTRAKVNDLSVTVDKVTPQQTGFIAEGEWTALGTVGHWGHQHQRVNRYKARLTVVPVSGEWKIRAMEVLEERRL
ncbi:MAG: hypothetical protein JWO94_3938, partial [Verrucomicrobiaceae bacterium]|nr:hypothetical protein [Verrucomicrobiaceae bacterium]